MVARSSQSTPSKSGHANFNSVLIVGIALLTNLQRGEIEADDLEILLYLQAFVGNLPANDLDSESNDKERQIIESLLSALSKYVPGEQPAAPVIPENIDSESTKKPD